MSSRPTTPHRPGRSPLSLVAGAVLIVGVPVSLIAAVRLAAAWAGAPRPVSRGLLWELLRTWSTPGDPAGWIGPQAPAAWLVWLLAAAIIACCAGVAVALWLLGSRLAPQPTSAGMATAEQEDVKLTAAAMIRRAPAMRPQLAATTRPRDLHPTQMGTPLGKSVATGQNIYRPIESSTIVTGLTESGKTSAVIIPAVLDFDARQLISTTKTDVLAATWQVSMDRGGVAVFDPLGLSGNAFDTVRYTPIAGCQDPDIAESRTQVLTFRPPGPDPNGDFRADGQRVVRALLHAAALADLTLSELMTWVYNPLDARPEQIIRTNPAGYTMYAEELASVRKSPDKQREGSYLSVRSAFDGMSAPRVLSCLNWRPSQAFSPAQWLCDGAESLYLLTHRTQARGATKVVSLMVSDILDAARLQAASTSGSRLDPPLSILADEALNTCRLNDWETVLADSRGWGISMTMVAQSRAMIRSAYGRDEGEGIWSAAGMRIMVGGGDGSSDTKELADAFGRHDVTTVSKELRGSGGSVSTRRDDVRTTADIRNLPSGRAIVLAAQTPPIEVQLQPWWERPDAADVQRAQQQYERRRGRRPSTPLAAIAS